MSPEQIDGVLASALGLAALPAGDQGYSIPGEDGLETELHVSAGRDWLLPLCPPSEYPDDGAHGAHLGALISNLTSARSGVPVTAFDAGRSAFLARKAVHLPCLAAHELDATIQEFAAHCREIRDRMAEAARALA